ncbi:hypothetical protein [Bacillus sp. UNC438CL73TsuS30]|uniref:hypothetical protein n=1 Tax=Bacillus sp. UNC438CL73TsuS30 TaxID=1340434 RepID=UPI00047DF02E|nr:hypothetical protein [Bacillus sp. UNC438CL73TsuS30]
MTPSAGIEPTSQEPESYVLSVAPPFDAFEGKRLYIKFTAVLHFHCAVFRTKPNDYGNIIVNDTNRLVNAKFTRGSRKRRRYLYKRKPSYSL